jgi:tetratricopeptide (TPR) repeat protein
VAENLRIEELRRRVESDPASIAFAQLAEEYRRAGQYDEAVHICRGGLEKHPTYLSARVTLGRALIELEQFDEAQAELEHVLQAAPENLAAIRGLAEIHQRRGEPAHLDVPATERLTSEPAAEEPAAEEPAGEWTLETYTPPSASPAGVDEALAEELPHEPAAPVDPVVLDPAEHAAVRELESWLGAIVVDRQSRGSHR